MRKLSKLCRIYRQPPHLTDYLCRSLSRTLRRRQVSSEVSQWFSPSPFPSLLPPSQTSLCCSKNKIPLVKLTALRFGAFSAKANQKLERDARHAHSGKVDTFKTTLEMSGCSEVHTHTRKSTENANLKSRFGAAYFSFPGKRHLNGKPNR